MWPLALESAWKSEEISTIFIEVSYTISHLLICINVDAVYVRDFGVDSAIVF